MSVNGHSVIITNKREGTMAEGHMLAFQSLEPLPHSHGDLTVSLGSPPEHLQWLRHPGRGPCMPRLAFPRLRGILLPSSTKSFGVYTPKRLSYPQEKIKLSFFFSVIKKPVSFIESKYLVCYSKQYFITT